MASIVPNLSEFYLEEEGSMSLRNNGDLCQTTKPEYVAVGISKSSFVPFCGP